ncbi:hypothetical protein JCM30394_27830 [Deferrisoma palaeochoriense]
MDAAPTDGPGPAAIRRPPRTTGAGRPCGAPRPVTPISPALFPLGGRKTNLSGTCRREAVPPPPVGGGQGEGAAAPVPSPRPAAGYTSSMPLKKNAISVAAVSGASEPCTEFFSTSTA